MKSGLYDQLDIINKVTRYARIAQVAAERFQSGTANLFKVELFTGPILWLIVQGPHDFPLDCLQALP